MSLRDTIARWPSRSSIRGAAIVSEDGFVIHDALAANTDTEAVAALAVSIVRHCQQLAEAASAGTLATVVLELDRSPAILTTLDDGHTLVVLAEPGKDLGQLLYDIRCEKPALKEAV